MVGLGLFRWLVLVCLDGWSWFVEIVVFGLFRWLVLVCLDSWFWFV